MAGMTVTAPAKPSLVSPRAVAALAVLAAAAALSVWAWHVPALAVLPTDWTLQLGEWLNVALNWALREAEVFGVTAASVTRDAAAWLAAPVTLLTEFLTEGLYLEFGQTEVWVPPLPWFTLAPLLLIGVWKIGGLWPTVLAAITLLYVLVCGLWATSVTTLIAVLFSVIVSIAVGLWLGVLAHRSARTKAVLEPFYDALQTVPVFSYLSVVLLLVGFGPVAGLVATVIFAMPPMARATELALRQVPSELDELASITGCSRRQRLWLVDLPAQMKTLMLGINQVIMLSLAMVIITSIIGAGGLGGEVVTSLRSLRMTDALLAGLAITLIAVVLDRATIAWANRAGGAPGSGARLWPLVAGLMALSVILMLVAPEAGLIPDGPLLDIGRSFDRGLDAFTTAAAPTLQSVQDVAILYYLRPLREAFALLPWAGTTLALAGIGLWFGGPRLALSIGLLSASIAILGLWPKAMTSLYLVLASILPAFVIGFPIGVLAGLSDRVNRVSTVVVDIIQTLPTFVYLIPVVTLFGVGDFAAFIAIVIFVVAPVVRYTAAGLRLVPPQLLEAAEMSGCRPGQRLCLVMLPLAFPQVLLGLNQAVMLGFSMLVITSLVGSRGLEETTLVAVAKVQPGDGLVAGFGIAALAIIVDRLMRGASKGLEARYAPQGGR